MHADDLILKLQDQVKSLVTRKWTDIERILEAEGEVKITFGSTLTDRETVPGEQADKSNRLKTTISFAERFTDSIECALVEHPELPLSYSGPVHTPTMPHEDDEGQPIADDVNLSSPGAVDAGTLPLGEALDQAASQKQQPLLDIKLDEAGWTVAGLRTSVRTEAGRKGSKWDKVALSLFLDLIDAAGDDLERVKEVIRPHTLIGNPQPAEVVSEVETAGV